MRFGSLALLVFAGAVATGAYATPITYSYYGEITDVSGYAGTSVGDPISFLVTYDPALIPPENESIDNAEVFQLQSLNGSYNGNPWITWMSVTASFGVYSVTNNLSDGYYNFGSLIVADGLAAGPFVADYYQPFAVNQQSSDLETSVFIEWYLRVVGTSNPALTSGTAFPQAVDLGGGEQFGVLRTQTPINVGGPITREIDFVLTQIDVPAGSVPEPDDMALLIAGFGALWLARRCKGKPPCSFLHRGSQA